MGILETIISGGATGVLGSLVSGAFAFFNERARHQRDLEMARMNHERDMERTKVDAAIAEREARNAERIMAMETEAAETAAEYDTLAASYAQDVAQFSAGVKSGWLVLVDVVRGLTRPGLTFGLVGLSGAIYFTTADPEVILLVVHAVLYASITATLWWFGSRQIEKAMNRAT